MTVSNLTLSHPLAAPSSRASTKGGFHPRHILLKSQHLLFPSPYGHSRPSSAFSPNEKSRKIERLLAICTTITCSCMPTNQSKNNAYCIMHILLAAAHQHWFVQCDWHQNHGASNCKPTHCCSSALVCTVQLLLVLWNTKSAHKQLRRPLSGCVLMLV